MSDHRDQIKFILQRYDVYINAVNVKGSFLLVFNTFLSSILAANYNTLISKLNSQNAITCFNVTLTVFLVVVLFAVINIFRAVYPFLKSGNSTIVGYHSLVFFNSVNEIADDSIFKKKFEDQLDLDMQNDLIAQTYQQAKGLARKFQLIKYAMVAIYIELVLVVVMLIGLLFF